MVDQVDDLAEVVVDGAPDAYPLFLTDRKARPSVATNDPDPDTGRSRLSYRRAAELFEAHTKSFDCGPYTLHQLRHSRLAHAAEEGHRRRC
ncbi:hypothetical protein [Nocardia abscessus]|uniref:hypothetical protein n=1 Tax=Nocardia abscessus TaxID=120957 RepID=UPI001D149048|nr:hypothetical protein [Nocardia abscessus]MCC3332178.1 hypothetical protein [Nocardia abscessus]